MCAELISADELAYFFDVVRSAPEEPILEENHYEYSDQATCEWEYEDSVHGESRELTIKVFPPEGDLVAEANFFGASVFVDGLGSHATQLFKPPTVGFIAVGERVGHVAYVGSDSTSVDESTLAKTREIAVRLAGLTDGGQGPTPLTLDCANVEAVASSAIGRTLTAGSPEKEGTCVFEAGEWERDYLTVTVALVRPKTPRDPEAWRENGETVVMRPELGPDSFTAATGSGGCVALHPGLEVLVVPYDDSGDTCPASVDIAKHLLGEL